MMHDIVWHSDINLFLPCILRNYASDLYTCHTAKTTAKAVSVGQRSQNFDSIFSVVTSLLINCEIIYWGKVLRSLRYLKTRKTILLIFRPP